MVSGGPDSSYCGKHAPSPTPKTLNCEPYLWHKKIPLTALRSYMCIWVFLYGHIYIEREREREKERERERERQREKQRGREIGRFHPPPPHTPTTFHRTLSVSRRYYLSNQARPTHNGMDHVKIQ